MLYTIQIHTLEIIISISQDEVLIALEMRVHLPVVSRPLHHHVM